MSNILDALNTLMQAKKKQDPSLHDEIAKIYFKTPEKKTDRKKTPKWLWLIVVLALLLALLPFIFKSSVDVKVTILSEMPTLRDNLMGRLRDTSDKGIFLMRGGKPNIEIIRKYEFLGDARAYSRVSEDMLVLSNSNAQGWANYTLEFKEPLNFNTFDINYTSKGERGDEHLVLVIVDEGNRSYRMEKDLSSALDKEWQTRRVSLKPLEGAIDISNVSYVRFEFGHLTVGNNPAATIFLKDVYITKTKGEKWL